MVSDVGPGLFTEVVTTSLRVVTAYRPVRNATGAMSVWNQQRSYFDEKMTIVALGTLQYSLGRRHSDMVSRGRPVWWHWTPTRT
jgi:hypothetical protein